MVQRIQTFVILSLIFFLPTGLFAEVLYFRLIINELEEDVEVTFSVNASRKYSRAYCREYMWEASEESIVVPPGKVLEGLGFIERQAGSHLFSVTFYLSIQDDDEGEQREPSGVILDLEMGENETFNEESLAAIRARYYERFSARAGSQASNMQVASRMRRAEGVQINTTLLHSICSHIHVHATRQNERGCGCNVVHLAMPQNIWTLEPRGVDQYGCSECCSGCCSFLRHGNSFFEGSPLAIVEGTCCGISFASDDIRLSSCPRRYFCCMLMLGGIATWAGFIAWLSHIVSGG